MPVVTPAQSTPLSTRDEGGYYGPGRIIAAKYRLTRLIGEGGMGEVWLAENTTLHVDVAIKLIRAEIAGSEEAAQRLLNEARAAAQIEHPSIVRVHDFGSTERDDPFIVMELLKGLSLDQLITRDGPLEPTRAVATLLPILGALASAHPKGIIHRDLKPDNILLCEDEQGAVTPKLVDFGIAKVKYRTIEVDEIPVHLDAPEMRRRLATKVTKMGQIVGSPEFMSPEQVRGDHDIDGRSDLWGIAVVLYDALTGDRPFHANSEEDILLAILSKDVAPIEDLDPELWSIIARALDKRRDKRWSDAREMGVALARWLIANGIDEDITGRSLKKWLGSAPPKPPRTPSADSPTRPAHAQAAVAHRRGRIVPWIVGAVVLGLAALSAAVALTQSGDVPVPVPTAESAAADIPPPPSAPLDEASPNEPPSVEPAEPSATAATRRPRPVARPRPSAPRPSPRAIPKGKGKLPIPDDVPF